MKLIFWYTSIFRSSANLIPKRSAIENYTPRRFSYHAQEVWGGWGSKSGAKKSNVFLRCTPSSRSLSRERDDDGREPDHENHRPDRAKRSRVDVVDVRHGPVSGMNNREI